MLRIFQKLPKQKIFLIGGFVLSIPVGALLGAFIGLMAVTFMPICCDDMGSCQNCFEFNGMVGYQATAYIGFWLGLLFIPVLYLFLIKRFIQRESIE